MLLRFVRLLRPLLLLTLLFFFLLPPRIAFTYFFIGDVSDSLRGKRRNASCPFFSPREVCGASRNPFATGCKGGVAVPASPVRGSFRGGDVPRATSAQRRPRSFATSLTSGRGRVTTSQRGAGRAAGASRSTVGTDDEDETESPAQAQVLTREMSDQAAYARRGGQPWSGFEPPKEIDPESERHTQDPNYT